MRHCNKCFTHWPHFSDRQENWGLQRSITYRGPTELIGGRVRLTHEPHFSPLWYLSWSHLWAVTPGPSPGTRIKPSWSSSIIKLRLMKRINITQIKVIMYVGILIHKVNSNWTYSNFCTISQFFQNTFSQVSEIRTERENTVQFLCLAFYCDSVWGQDSKSK